MEKTILRLSKEVSIIVLSSLIILFTFLSTYIPVSGVISFIFMFVKSIVFLLIPLFVYILENNCVKFKRVAGIYSSYFVINLLLTIVDSISIVNEIIPVLWKNLIELANLLILLSALFIIIEQMLEYNDIKSKIYSNTIMYVVYIVGEFISRPILMFINKKIQKEK